MTSCYANQINDIRNKKNKQKKQRLPDQCEISDSFSPPTLTLGALDIALLRNSLSEFIIISSPLRYVLHYDAAQCCKQQPAPDLYLLFISISQCLILLFKENVLVTKQDFVV